MMVVDIIDSVFQVDWMRLLWKIQSGKTKLLRSWIVISKTRRRIGRFKDARGFFLQEDVCIPKPFCFASLLIDPHDLNVLYTGRIFGV